MLFYWLMLGEEDRKKKLILASASPRRKEILDLLKLDFEIVRPKNFEEKQFKNPCRMVVRNSIIKAKNVYNYLKERDIKNQGSNRRDEFLIAGFDTVVYINKKIMGKPSDMEQAEKYLRILSGKVHKVITGVCILESVSGRYRYSTESTGVKFRRLTADEIKKYTDRENVLDKAGAYNILGYGSVLVEKISGCFYNIAGLPVANFINMLKRSGFNVIS